MQRRGYVLAMMLPIISGCSTVVVKEHCPPAPIPSNHVVAVIDSVRSHDRETDQWWTDVARHVAACEAINRIGSAQPRP